ncbi:hypothetical protein CDAR_4911 [Caerostris darwini]|uniref:Uncharacterized protein n=1 Tax=Caerostris darwini TaxID=1538125 RepID=A0AAV4P7Q9_9ARAC|nr:hypothetical protein CDAR_4911 [Caerostris darwini]
MLILYRITCSLFHCPFLLNQTPSIIISSPLYTAENSGWRALILKTRGRSAEIQCHLDHSHVTSDGGEHLISPSTLPRPHPFCGMPPSNDGSKGVLRESSPASNGEVHGFSPFRPLCRMKAVA